MYFMILQCSQLDTPFPSLYYLSTHCIVLPFIVTVSTASLVSPKTRQGISREREDRFVASCKRERGEGRDAVVQIK